MASSYRTVLVGLILLLLVAPGVHAAPQTSSGNFQLTYSDPTGTSQYTILYSHPTQVDVGQNLTITVTVEINQLTELKEYLIDWAVAATVFTANAGALMGNVTSPPTTTNYLYPGSHWGPENITIPVESSEVGMSPGQTMNATLQLQFTGDVWYAKPINYHSYDSGEGAAGSILISDPRPASQTYVLYAGYAAIAAVAVVLGWYVIRLQSRKPVSTNVSPT